MLIIHISLAVISLIWSTAMWFSPSQKKLQASYLLTVGTLITGTYLVISTHQAMLQACATGLLYTAVSLVAIGASRNKLAAQRNRS